jgi:hypothetical protein
VCQGGSENFGGVPRILLGHFHNILIFLESSAQAQLIGTLVG